MSYFSDAYSRYFGRRRKPARKKAATKTTRRARKTDPVMGDIQRIEKMHKTFAGKRR